MPDQTWDVLWQVAIILAAAVIAVVAFSAACTLAMRMQNDRQAIVLRQTRNPGRVLSPLLAVLLVLPVLQLPADIEDILRRVLGLTIIASFGWLAISIVGAVEQIVMARYPLEMENNLEARTMRTRMRVLSNVSVGILSVLTIAILLTSFPSVRQLGVSLLASAGIIALVAGMAARPALANLIAGLQIALTQPIRIDDVVVIEGEWGRIEEITSSYVVVRIWDSRRLIVPLSYIVGNNIENWTRSTSDILGTVFVYADYSTPVARVRTKLQEILKAEPLWDGRVCALQVTDATERAVQLRALMSARNSSDAWDLRCIVREKLVEYLQHESPASLPQVRVHENGHRAQSAAV